MIYKRILVAIDGNGPAVAALRETLLTSRRRVHGPSHHCRRRALVTRADRHGYTWPDRIGSNSSRQQCRCGRGGRTGTGIARSWLGGSRCSIISGRIT